MLRLGGEGSPQPATHPLPLCPAANAGPATLHPSTPKEVTRQCFQSNTSSSVFRSVAHNPKCKLKTEVKPVLCKGKRLTGLPFTRQNLAPLIHGCKQLMTPLISVEKTWNQVPVASS